jgi:cyclophilin family peptidyl-prolyl cis-trans isomerase
MQILTRLSVIILLYVGTNLGLKAGDLPAAKPGPAKEEFKKVHAEFNAVNAELRLLQVEYRKSAKEDRPALENKWRDTFRKGAEIQARYLQAAEKAFAEAPNADKEITALLWSIFGYQISSDDYENAARVGKLLIDNGNNDARGLALAGVASVAVGDSPSAAGYFDKAKKTEIFKKPPDTKDQQLMNAFQFAMVLPQVEQNWKQEQKIREAEAKADDLPRVLIKTEHGEMVVELFENEAPNTVANFISLVEKKFYDGLTFHRVLAGFMAQGGDPKGDGTGGPGYFIPCECSQPNHRNHFRGTLSMAHAGRDTGGSQFFICYLPTPQLDGKHTAFGRVISGFDVLSKIKHRDPEDPNAPDPDKIVEMKVLRKRDHEYKVKKVGE